MAPRLPERPLRLLHVSPSFYPALSYGGPVASLYELCLAQQRAGVHVKVLTSTAGLSGAAAHRHLLGWVEEFGVPTYYAPVRLPPDLAPGMVPQLVTLARWAEVVHVTGLFSGASVLAVMIGLASRRAVVLSPRGALLPWALAQRGGQARKQRFLTALAPLLRRVHGWHATSNEEADAVRDVLRRLGSPQANIRVVAPGVVGSVATSSAESTSGNDSVAAAKQAPSYQLLVLGRIHPVKNLELAIATLARLRADFPAVTLVVAGPEADERYVAELRARVTALGLDAAVKWPGLVTGAAKQRLLAGSAVLWLGSHMESFGNVVVEALAAGTPVVATQTTPWEQLDTAQVGHWVAATPKALAAATRELFARLHDADARQQLADRCREYARTRFSWQLAEQQMQTLYLSARERATSAS